MIVIMDVEPPYNEGVISLTFAAGNSNGGVEIQTAEQDLQGIALTVLTVGDEQNEVSKRALERIKEAATIIMKEEYGDNVCEKV